MRIYIAGPMRGHYLYNFPAFDEAAASLRLSGHDPVNPADLDRAEGFDPYTLESPDWNEMPPGTHASDFADRDLAALAKCDAIFMLRGWEKSVGARAEYAVARWRGLKVMTEAEGIEAPEDAGTSGAEKRKQMPVATGVLDYFPDAIRALAHCSWVGNEQHNPGEPLHWSRDKSSDHADCLMRHFMERGTVDSDGVRHSTKAAWRALAMLQLELESNRPVGDFPNDSSCDGAGSMVDKFKAGRDGGRE